MRMAVTEWGEMSNFGKSSVRKKYQKRAANHKKINIFLMVRPWLSRRVFPKTKLIINLELELSIPVRVQVLANDGE